MNARAATPGDSEVIARIYNQGIEDRIATFPREDFAAQIDSPLPIQTGRGTFHPGGAK